MANGYRNALVQQIKDAGQELINRAESMVHPENDLITDFSIVIHFEQHEVPTNRLHNQRGKQSCLRSGYLSERRIQCLKNMMNIWKNTGKL